MSKLIRIEAPDSDGAAHLMEKLVGGLRAWLIHDDDGRWEVLVSPEAEPTSSIRHVIDLVQRSVDEGAMDAATIHFGDRMYTIGAAAPGR